MVTRKHSYTSSSSAYFPPPTHGTKRRETFDDVLDRAAKRDNERNPSEGENYKYENLVILKCLSVKHA